MNFFNYVMFFGLLLFYLVFLTRTIQLRLRGTKPLVLGKGKKGFNALLEISFFVGLLVWTFEIITTSLRIGVHVLPDFFYQSLFDVYLLKIIGTFFIAGGGNAFHLGDCLLRSFLEDWY